MKKIQKLFFALIFAIVLFLTILAKITIPTAEEALKITDIKYANSMSGILYSNNKLLVWDESNNTLTLENIKSFEMGDYGHFITLNKNDELKYNYIGSTTEEKSIAQDIESYYIGWDGIVYKDKNGNLYMTCDYRDYACRNSNEHQLIASNVKEFKVFINTLLYLTNNNELYVAGTNYFGSEVNEGVDFTSPYKLLDDIKIFDFDYALSFNGDLYKFTKETKTPQVISTNVKNFIHDANENDITYSELYRDFYIYLEKNDDTKYLANYSLENYSFKLVKEIPVDFEAREMLSDEYKAYILSNSGNLYSLIKGELNVIDSKVKDIERSEHWSNNDFYLLYENGDMYNYFYDRSNNDTNLTKTLLHEDKLQPNSKYRLLKNVETIEFIYPEEYTFINKIDCAGNMIILTDGSVLRFGDNFYNQFKNPELPDSYIPVKIDELINNSKPINALDITVGPVSKTEFTVGDTYNLYASVIPYNAINRDVTWTTSDESKASVTQDGKVSINSPGSVDICANVTTNSNIKSCITINGHSKANQLVIENGDKLDVELNKNYLLTANYLPSDTLETEVEWSVESGDSKNVSFNNYAYYNSEDQEAKANQTFISISAGGTYVIKASSKDGKLTDTITLNVVEKVRNINIKINSANYDGSYNAYIYMNESNTLKVEATVSPSTATNQKLKWKSGDTSIAEVSQDGVITGKKVGRTSITITSEDGNATKTFYVIIYDYSSQKQIQPGDVNGDGKVNILDLVKLRRYLAGLEKLD